MKTKVLRKTISMVLSLLFILSCFPALPIKAEAAAPGVYDLTISNTDQQTVKGWGVFPAWNRADWNANFIDKTGAQQALYNDLGATIFRYMLPAVNGDADGNVIDAKMQEMYDLINVGEARGEHDYTISVWSPPVGMKTLPTVNGWTGTEHVMLRTDKEDAYAHYLVNAIQWLMAKGSSAPKSISFQNEPLSQIISEWCYWGADNGAQYQRVTKLLRAKLDAAGLVNVQIIAAEGAAYDDNEYLLGTGFSALKNDAALDNAIGGFASHSYLKKGFSTVDMYKAYTNAADSFPSKDKWQTEYSTLIEGNSEQDMAINTAQRLAGDMALVKNNYWLWWLGWSATRHPTDWGEVLLDGDGYTVTKSKAFSVLSKVFNNVPVGSKVRRVTADPASGLTTSDAITMDAVAFVNGTKTTALLVNSTDTGKKVNVKGLTGATASVYQMSSNMAKGADMSLVGASNIYGGTASYIDLPAKSVTVIVTSDTDTAPPQITFDQANSSSVKDASYAVRNSQFTVSGHLDEAGTLLINGVSAAVANDLSFSQIVNLQSGVNTISAVSTDTLGNTGNPAKLLIRYDPAYLGLTLDQSSMSYVNQSSYTITGTTNGSAAVNINQQNNGTTVSNATYNVVVNQNVKIGDTIQAIYQDSFISAGVMSIASGGFSTVDSSGALTSGYVIDSNTSFVPAEGLKSLRLKFNGGLDLSRVGINFVNSSFNAIQADFSAKKATAGLHFWVYTKRQVDSFSIELASNNNGKLVESRVPIANYLKAADYGNKWVEITVPFADFPDTGVYVDTSTGLKTNMPFLWDQVKGIGFSTSTVTSGFYDPHVDDIRVVYTSVPTGASSIHANLNLLEGDNTVTASAYNELGQNAVPATIHVIYDSIAPVIKVPSTGLTTSTGYVLKGSVSEKAAIKINGVLTNQAADNTFTVIVPVTKGLNTLTIDAQDLAGNHSQAIVQVTCNPLDDGALSKGVAASNKTSAAITIDGNLTESGWNINNVVNKMITGTSDNNVAFGTMWDNTYLYVGVKVLDANLVNDSTLAYQDDSVEVYIDGDGKQSSSYDKNDHQITLGWHDNQLAVGGDIPGIKFAQQDIEGGYTVEMAIPWDGIGVAAPNAESVIGFDIGNNDDDSHNNGLRESQLMWNGTGNNWQNTSAFGSLYLSDGRNVASAAEPSKAVIVDGSLDENSWNLTNNVTKKISGTSDNSVRFGTLSDKQYLYVGIDVLDANLRNDSAQPYQDDSVEVYLDANNSKSATYDAYDHQITVRWHDNQLYMIGAIPGIQFAQKDTAGGYSVEMAIPWTGLNITPTKDMTIGLDVGNNDDDGHNNGLRESQTMWNGTGNNWQNTSGFGGLLLHNASFPLPQTVDPNGLVTFTDDATDLTKLYAKTANIVAVNWHPEFFAGDADRIAHNNDNPMSPESVIYKSPAGDIFSFDITTGLFNNSQFTFYGSGDGVNFTQLNASSTIVGGANGYTVFSNKASNLTAGIQYIKIVFPGKANWQEQLSKVTFQYYGKPTAPPEDAVKAVFTDEGADLSKLYAKSAHIGNASWQPEKFGNDSTRIIHTNDDAIFSENIIYKSPDADIYSFEIPVTVFFNLPASSVFAFYGSTDGISFTKIPVSPTMTSSASGFNTLNYKATSMSRGYRYLKIEFPFGTVDCDNWTASINKVSFVYGSTSIPVSGVTLDKTALSLNIGEVSSLTATVAPDNAANKAVTWSSSNPAVAAVDSSGTVTGAGVGTATITVTTVDGSKTAECIVQVLPVLDLVTLKADKTALKSASTALLSVSGVMSDGSQADLTQAVTVFTSDNEQVATVDGSGTVTAVGEGTANVKATVTLRGITKVGSTQIIVDNTPPTTLSNVDKTAKNGWYNSDVTVTLSATDNLSGVTASEYSLDGGIAWQAYTTPVTLNQDGKYVVSYRSTDKAGNVETVKTVGINLDKTAPVTTASVSPIQPDGQSSWYVHPVTVSLNALDEMSGVAKTEYSLDDGNTWQAYTAPVMLNQDGKYVVSYRSTDEAGNVETVKTVAFNLDETAPVTIASVSPAQPDGQNGWYVHPVTVTLSATDNLSGVNKIEYRIGGSGVWIDYTLPITLINDGSYSVQFHSTDKAGNIEDVKQLSMQIDKTLPSFSLTVNGNVLNEGGTFNDDLPLTFKVWDYLSGIASARITIAGTEYVIDPITQSSKDIDLSGKPGSYTATIVVEDKAGNKLEKTFLFTIATSIDSMRNLIQRFVQAGELSGPLVAQLTNNLDQAQHQLDKGRLDQAAKHMQDFVKHLNNAALGNNISAKAKAVLNNDANYLITLWS